MVSDAERLEFLKELSETLIRVGKTIEFLLSDDSIPLKNKEETVGELFNNKIADLVATHYSKRTEELGQDIAALDSDDSDNYPYDGDEFQGEDNYFEGEDCD